MNRSHATTSTRKACCTPGFLDLAPPAALRIRAVRTFVEFLRRSDKDRDRRALWFAHVRLLLDRSDPAILTAFDESGDFVLVAVRARAAGPDRATPVEA